MKNLRPNHSVQPTASNTNYNSKRINIENSTGSRAQGQTFIIQLSNERNVEVGRYFGIKGVYRVREALNCSFLFTE